MRLYGITLVGGLLLCCASLDSNAADHVPVETLIDQLDDRDFARREAALRQLAQRGPSAIDQLVAAARTESLEVASRAVQLLEQMLASDDVAASDAADLALVTLSESDQPHAMALATAALGRNAAVREERAVAKIRELGGQVQYDVPRDPLGQPRRIQLPPGTGEVKDPILEPRVIVLKRRWQGGVAGLAHLRKLSHIAGMQLYVVNGCGVPLEQAQALASVLPGLEVHERGAYLGVTGGRSNRDRCLIGLVQPDGPAAAAGLKADDTVLALDGQPVGDFDELVLMLTKRSQGDHVTITVARPGRTLDLDVELGEWNLPPRAGGSGPPARPGRLAPPPGLPVPPQFPPQR